MSQAGDQVESEKDSDVDLFVYDENGKEVVKDVGESKNCHVTFTPDKTQTYKIEVQNRKLTPESLPQNKARNIDNRVTLKWEPKS